ncbi:MAG: Methylglutaconyl-CoA hydratase [Bacteriovoracaceae bacterium]|nr:Methylglutaconyl-CoA hydratase [Bacteriovoracaceae bacterium]
MNSFIQTEIKSSVLFLTLNRPDSKNAMNAEMMTEIRAALSKISNDLRAVVVRGAGPFFCAGGDLHWMKSSINKTQKENEEDALNLARMIRALDECPIPVITQVKGGAFGGGVGLVAASDIVIAEENSVFSLSEVKLGLIPATIGPIVMRKIGVSEARRLYLTGKRFSAAVAKDIHLVHEVVPTSTILSVTNDYLNELSSAAPEAVRTAKQLIRETMGESLWKDDVSESTSKILSEIRVGAEAQEGMKAFFEKRTPSWKKALTNL